MYAHILMIPSNYESIETGEELYVNIILCWMEYYFSSAYSPENTFLLPTYIFSLRKRNTKLELDISNNTGLTGLKIRQCNIFGCVTIGVCKSIQLIMPLSREKETISILFTSICTFWDPVCWFQKLCWIHNPT